MFYNTDSYSNRLVTVSCDKKQLLKKYPHLLSINTFSKHTKSSAEDLLKRTCLSLIGRFRASVFRNTTDHAVEHIYHGLLF